MNMHNYEPISSKSHKWFARHGTTTQVAIVDICTLTGPTLCMGCTHFEVSLLLDCQRLEKPPSSLVPQKSINVFPDCNIAAHFVFSLPCETVLDCGMRSQFAVFVNTSR